MPSYDHYPLQNTTTLLPGQSLGLELPCSTRPRINVEVTTGVKTVPPDAFVSYDSSLCCFVLTLINESKVDSFTVEVLGTTCTPDLFVVCFGPVS
jgi:hypothetical protein